MVESRIHAAYLNAIGGIHGPNSSHEFSGKVYRRYGIRVLSGTQKTHMSDAPEAFARKNRREIEQAGSFFNALFSRQFKFPPQIEKSGHAPVNPAVSGVDSINTNKENFHGRQTYSRILFQQ